MDNAWELIKERWYWFVGALIGIWLVSKWIGSSGSANTTSSATLPAGVAVQYTGTNANDAAIQVANTQAQSTLAGQQIAGSIAVQQAQIAEQAQEDTNASNVSIANLQGQYGLAITNSNNTAAMHESDNNTALAVVQSNNGLTLGTVQSDNATKLGIVQSSNAVRVSTLQANDALALGLDTNATNLAALKDNNQTQLAAYGIQANVANHQVDALQNIAIAVSDNAASVQTEALNDATEVQSQQLSNQGTVINDTYQLMKAGVFNKGGEGGTNQVGVWNTLTSPASATTADAASATVGATQATQLQNIITAIGGAVKGGLSQVFA